MTTRLRLSMYLFTAHLNTYIFGIRNI